MPVEDHALTFPESVKIQVPLGDTTDTHTVAFRPYGDWKYATKLIITVHGLTGDSLNFHYLSEYFINKPNYAVINIDIMGRGDSQSIHDGTIAPEWYTNTQYITDIFAILSLVKQNHNDADSIKWYWVGTSMGGLLAMGLTERIEELNGLNIVFSALMFNDIGPFLPVNESSNISEYLKNEHFFKNRDEAATWLRLMFRPVFGPKTDAKFYAHRALYALKYDKDLDVGENPLPYRFNMDIAGVIHGLVQRTNWDVVDFEQDVLEQYQDENGDPEQKNKTKIGNCYSMLKQFEKLSAPLLVYHGTKSNILVNEFISVMDSIYKDKIKKDFQCVKWDKTGHVPPLYAEEELVPIFEWFEKY